MEEIQENVKERAKKKPEKKNHRVFKIIRRIILGVLAAWLVFLLIKDLVYGRWNFSGKSSGEAAEIEVSYEEAIADGLLSEEEIANHFAPEIDAAVNVLISKSGKGDFICAADYDGDTAANNNWEHLGDYPLNAVIYYSVQETETHYYVGYYFYHARDDAEVWVDKHENDLEGIMLAVRKAENSFGEVEVMYTEGHGYVPFYYNDETFTITEGSKNDGKILMNGSHPVIYITPNGTLLNAGHSVESAENHSLYWSVLNSGVFYYNGGVAEEPATFKGAYEDNPCSYELVSVDCLWDLRNGPYGDGCIFAEFGAFCGDNYGTNSANPPWGWRNKTAFGFGGSFLSDPVWTISHAISGIDNLSANYINNKYADFIVQVDSVELGASVEPGTVIYVAINQGGWDLSNTSWWSAEVTEGTTVYYPDFGGVNKIYVAAAATTEFTVRLCDADGNTIEDATVNWSLTKNN